MKTNIVAGSLGVWLACMAAQPLAGRVQDDAFANARAVPKAQLVDAMQRQKREGYDLTATANGVRLQVGVILDVVREAAQRDPTRQPLRINHEDYFDAFLETLALTPDQAPVFIRAAHEHLEDQIVDYRVEHVIARVVAGGRPRSAMNVVAGWPTRDGAPERYSYEDRRSDPHLRVTHDRTNFYRIVDFGDVVLYDDIRGIRGRATSGVLGFVFNLIGDGRAVQTRLAFSSDGLQLSRTTAKKLLTITQTVTVDKAGKAEKGVPKGRPDLSQIADRLEQPLEIEYQPVTVTGMPARR